MIKCFSTTFPTNVEILGVVDGLASSPVLPFVLLSNQLLNSFIPFCSSNVALRVLEYVFGVKIREDDNPILMVMEL